MDYWHKVDLLAANIIIMIIFAILKKWKL